MLQLLKYVQKHFTRCISVRANSRRYCALYFDWHTFVHYDRVSSLKQENASSTLYHHIASYDDRFQLRDGETPFMKIVRFRTLGCYPLTAAVESTATTIEEVVEEVLQVKLSERATRLIDGDNEDSMEKKKTEGYF